MTRWMDGLSWMTALMAAALGASAAPAQESSDGYAAVTVDASRTVGSFKQLRGVNGAPDMRYMGATTNTERRPPDISAAYRQARINLVRTHDSNSAGDLDPTRGNLPDLGKVGLGTGSVNFDQNLIFPNPAADPADPRSYNFGPTDQLIAGIRAIGADVIFRLGRGGGTTAAPPADTRRYAEIIRHVVLHYNRGWNKGLRNAVKYWEVWNEPDLYQIWWRGTPQQFYDLYGAAALAVKAADPKAQVGGSTIALSYNEQPYREGFLAYVRDRTLPLDFFSWHWYSWADDPYEYRFVGDEVRRLLDSYGFTRTTSMLDEWNGNLKRGIGQDTAFQAAFITTSRMYMEDAPIDAEAYFRADRALGVTPLGKVGSALVALGRMADTPVRLEANGGDTQGLAVQAGRSRDGRLIQVLISNYEVPADNREPRNGPDVVEIPNVLSFKVPPRRTYDYAHNKGYDLQIAGLAGRTYTVERYRISDSSTLALVDRAEQRGPDLRLTAALPAPAVELVVLRTK